MLVFFLHTFLTAKLFHLQPVIEKNSAKMPMKYEGLFTEYIASVGRLTIDKLTHRYATKSSGRLLQPIDFVAERRASAAPMPPKFQPNRLALHRFTSFW